MYVSFQCYPSAVGMLVGFDLAQPQPVLKGFTEWMSARHGESNLWFASLALIEHTGRESADEYAHFRDVDPDEEVTAVRHLCALLREYLALSDGEVPLARIGLRHDSAADLQRQPVDGGRDFDAAPVAPARDGRRLLL